jgi:hypothetical protein
LTVDLGQKLLRQAVLDALAEPPDRGMVGRLLIERNAAKAPKRQPIAYVFLRAGVGEPVPLLEKHDLEHVRLGLRPKKNAMDPSRRRQLECLDDIFQESAHTRIGLHKGVGE